MKAINAVQVWKNGEEKQANMFNLVLINEDYLDWDGSNDAAYNFVAGKLNLTIAD